MATNIIYLRVSKEEKNLQDLLPQRFAILSKYELDEKDCLILEEKGSAYDLDKLHKRKEYLKLLDMLFDSKTTYLHDLFLRNYEKKEINLYVWDYHRLMRNFEFSLLFGLLCDFFDVKIFSHKQGHIKKRELETPIEKFSRYIFYAINSFSSEDYSYNISTNVKKSVRIKDEVTLSTNGKKWGRRFKDLKGERVDLDVDTVIYMTGRVKYLLKYYKKKKKEHYHNLVITKIRKEFSIDLSPAYITKIKNNEEMKKNGKNTISNLKD